MNEKLQNSRTEYLKGALNPEEMASDALEQFKRWYEEYESIQDTDPTAMTLATVDGEGQPHARVVLLKGLQAGGFEFYSNYQSAKARELAANPRASLSFFWPELERQVRVEGQVEKLSPAESDAYFNSRPHGSQVGAWVSPQSEEVPNRAFLEEKAAFYAAQYPDAVPRPPHWGGYRLKPVQIEFWQGRPSRLHDRIVYRVQADGSWRRLRLAP